MNKRCVFFIGTLNQGGAERVISILTKHMADAKEQVKIILYYDEDPFYAIHPDVEIVRLERETGTKGLLKNFFRLRKYIKENADVLISFLAPFNIIAILASLGLRKRVIVADRNDPRHVPSNKLVRLARNFLYRFANGVVVQNTDNKNYFSKTVQKKSSVIFNPVDLGEKRGQALRTEKKKRVVSVGRLIKQKNQEMLLDAFAEIHGDFPEHILTIYGEGDYRATLENKIKEFGLEGFVELPGSRKDVFDLISDAELFVLSSNYEGMPNALIEAMCLGLPVISTAVSGTSDLIEDGLNGRVTEVGNKQQLVEAMREMLSSEDMCKRCAENAVLINDKLEIKGVMSEWQKFIEEVR